MCGCARVNAGSPSNMAHEVDSSFCAEVILTLNVSNRTISYLLSDNVDCSLLHFNVLWLEANS